MSSSSREAGTSPRAGRAPRRRLSGSQLFIGVVVLLAFVLNLVALQDRSATTLVAVADGPIDAGATFSVDVVRFVPVSSAFEGLGSLLTEEQAGSVEGWVFDRPVDSGGVIERGLLVEPAAPSGMRSMSIPIAPEHAAGGALAVGDRVDVITVVDGVARFVAVDVGVVGIAASDSGAFGTIGSYYVILAVEPAQSLALAEAIESGSVELIRATGAIPLEEDSLDDS